MPQFAVGGEDLLPSPPRIAHDCGGRRQPTVPVDSDVRVLHAAADDGRLDVRHLRWVAPGRRRRDRSTGMRMLRIMGVEGFLPRPIVLRYLIPTMYACLRARVSDT